MESKEAFVDYNGKFIWAGNTWRLSIRTALFTLCPPKATILSSFAVTYLTISAEEMARLPGRPEIRAEMPDFVLSTLF
jgi:hypothetical protein